MTRSRVAAATAVLLVPAAVAVSPARAGDARSAVQLTSPAFDNVFTIGRCTTKTRDDLVLSGSAPNGVVIRLAFNPTAKGLLRLSQDDRHALAKVRSVRVGADGSISASGRFTSGLPGGFTLAGECSMLDVLARRHY